LVLHIKAGLPFFCYPSAKMVIVVLQFQYYAITITMMVVITALVTSLVIVIFSALIIENHLIRKLEVVNHIVKITKLCQKEF